MAEKITTILPPSDGERKSLRLMIFIGLLSMAFFLYSILQQRNISYLPLYVLLMITLFYYSFKYLHEWYHYFSISVSPAPSPSKIYTVDILTTYCAGEPFEMLEQTLTAIQKITYPHTAWCCDEADDPLVKQLCTRLGVKHVTRTIKKDAKAGNINNALQFATGEICLVLDPDHIPVPEILDEVVPYFDDPAIGFVQIIQAYYNQTETMVAKGAAQQTYQFYGPVMMTMNRYGTVQAIGANCTFRRAALDSIGGHASGLAEDMHTAMRMHAAGWRSVYVPKILTRGLVPATMSSYYKQQLKWSRGTWELFVAVFPKLFTRFTWRQKIHYFTLPFHYLSGLIFLINFLIPVISLVTGYIPLQMDTANFLLAAFPLFCMAIFIRHYVQQWVAEETERGFHIVGGILQIGTWWIHSVGFFYTLFRKKVPYIPTPKNDTDSLPLSLNIPNMLVAIISLAAILYGLRHDNSPYTVFMALLASLQIVFMVFIFSISGYIKDDSKINKLATRLKAKNGLIVWLHGFFRRYSVALSVVVILLFITAYIQKQQLPDYLPEPLPGLQVFYHGIYMEDTTGRVAAGKVNDELTKANKAMIVAITLPVNEKNETVLDTILLKQVYEKHRIPLLIWRPWKNIAAAGILNNRIFCKQLLDGNFDTAIASFSRQLSLVNKPIFLVYENEPGPAASVPHDQDATRPADEVATWRYVHDAFKKAGADKVIWVWHHSSPAAASMYFPGNNYVDWLAVDMYENNFLFRSQGSDAFDSLFRPYHQQSLFESSGLPVMVMTTPRVVINEAVWNNAFQSIDTAFTEIKAIIAGSGDGAFFNQLPYLTGNTIPLTALPAIERKTITATKNKHTNFSMIPGIKNVVYNKGYRWFRNRHTLSIRTISTDIEAMKKLGINTIERTMPGVYDETIEKVLLENQMNLIPHFLLPESIQDVMDDGQLEKYAREIMQFIKTNQLKKNIIAWNIGNDGLYNLGSQSFKPDYFYYEAKYVQWLQNLCARIRAVDTVRPIIMDVHWDARGEARYRYYTEHVPLINCFMLEADVKYQQGLQYPLQKNMRWGKVPVELWKNLPSIGADGTLPAWQDIENTRYILLNGILDLEGRTKAGFATVMQTWGNETPLPSPIPEISILRPALITRTNRMLTYRVVYKKSNARWMAFGNDSTQIRFEWYLVRTDQYDNTMFIKKAGEGSAIQLLVPAGAQYYQLYVEAVAGNQVKMVNTTLNTPLE